MPHRIAKPDKRVPKLRFPEFSGEWEEKKLGEVASLLKGKDISRDNVSADGIHPCVRYGELYTEYSELIHEVRSRTNVSPKMSTESKRGDVLIPSSGETAIDMATTSCIQQDGVLIGGDINIVRPKQQDGVFLSYMLSNFHRRKIARVAQGYSVVHLYGSFLKSLEINLPSLPEQQKISDFLSSVDEWIRDLKQQKEAYESYKKGLMQKIFAREIRFKDENGKPFPDWEEKRLGELGQTFNGLTGKSAEDFGSGNPFITYKQIFDSNEIDVDKFAFVKIGTNEKQNKTQFGDILITTSSETPQEVGFASVLLDKNVTPYLNSFSFGIRPDSLDKLNPFFSKFFFRSPMFRRKIVRLSQGSTRYNISKIEFMKMRLPLPSVPEQQKIADFLGSIDALINNRDTVIAQTEQWKRGLMQGLFV